MSCPLNCYSDSSTPVVLSTARSYADGFQRAEQLPEEGVKATSAEACQALCRPSAACEAVVYSRADGRCWGKKDVRTFKCEGGGGDFVTDFVSVLPVGSCTIMGDPHVLAFDNPNGGSEDISILEPGVFPLVTSSELQIYGRFGFSHRFPTMTSLTGVAVTGMLCGGSKIALEYKGPRGMEGFWATVDGVRILQGGLNDTFRTPHISAMLAKMEPEYFNVQARHTIGGTPQSGTLPSFVFECSRLIRLYVLLGSDTMNAVITMRKLKVPQQGVCGNFNCDAADDTLEALQRRGQARPLPASVEGRLFHSAAAAGGASQLFSWLPRLPSGSAPLPDGMHCIYALVMVVAISAGLALGITARRSTPSSRGPALLRVQAQETVDISDEDNESEWLLSRGLIRD